MNRANVLSIIHSLQCDLRVLEEIVSADEIVLKKPKSKVAKGAIDELKSHADILEKVAQSLQDRWLTQHKDASWVNSEIMKCRIWCQANHRHTKNWGRRISAWLGNATPAEAPAPNKMLVSR